MRRDADLQGEATSFILYYMFAFAHNQLKDCLLVICRVVPWGRPMIDIGLPYLKAIGIRVHTVRYQKVRKRIVLKEGEEKGGDIDPVTSNEYKRIKGMSAIYSYVV